MSIKKANKILTDHGTRTGDVHLTSVLINGDRIFKKHLHWGHWVMSIADAVPPRWAPEEALYKWADVVVCRWCDYNITQGNKLYCPKCGRFQ